MSGSLNKIMLIGYVGKTPEVRLTQEGRSVASFSLATSNSWTDKNTGERKESTDWHKIAVFNERLIPIIQTYVRKGSKLYIEGESKTRKWTDKNGVDHYITEVVLQQFNGVLTLLDSKRDDEVAQESDNQPEEFNDEISF